MWPHSFVLALRSALVCVGTDDADLADLFAPWATDSDRTVVDFGLQLHPDPSAERGLARTLPSLRHGSCLLAATDDRELLRRGLLDCLGSFDRDLGESELRIRGVVLEYDGAGFVFPKRLLEVVPVRQLARWGVRPHPAVSCVVDVTEHTVLVGPPLGGSEPTRVPLGGIRLTHRHPEEPTTPAVDVARLIGNLEFHGGEPVPAQVLALAVRLVTSVPIRYVSAERAGLENELTALIGR